MYDRKTVFVLRAVTNGPPLEPNQRYPNRIGDYALHAFYTSRVSEFSARNFAFSPTFRTCFPWTAALGETAVYSGRRSPRTVFFGTLLIRVRFYLISHVKVTIDHCPSSALNSDTIPRVPLIRWIFLLICRHLVFLTELDLRQTQVP